MVIQDTHLFTGTIADNIRYGNLNASDEEVIKRQLSECARVYTRSSQVMQQYREKELSER